MFKTVLTNKSISNSLRNLDTRIDEIDKCIKDSVETITIRIDEIENNINNIL